MMSALVANRVSAAPSVMTSRVFIPPPRTALRRRARKSLPLLSRKSIQPQLAMSEFRIAEFSDDLDHLPRQRAMISRLLATEMELVQMHIQEHRRLDAFDDHGVAPLHRRSRIPTNAPPCAATARPRAACACKPVNSRMPARRRCPLRGAFAADKT